MGVSERTQAGESGFARRASGRVEWRLDLLLLVVALAVAGATAAGILGLPAVGSVRYPALSPNSSYLRAQQAAKVLGGYATAAQADKALLANFRSSGSLATFQLATYWKPADIATRRNNILAAGGILVLAFTLTAGILRIRATPTPSRLADDPRDASQPVSDAT